MHLKVSYTFCPTTQKREASEQKGFKIQILHRKINEMVPFHMQLNQLLPNIVALKNVLNKIENEVALGKYC